MPVTYEQLLQQAKQNQGQYREDRKRIMQFSKVMLHVAQQLLKSEDEYENQIGENLKKYSSAMDQSILDPIDPRNRQDIESALDTLFTMEDYLGGASSEIALDKYKRNIYAELLALNEANDRDQVEEGTRAINRMFGFGINVNGLMQGNVIEPDPRKREEQRRAWIGQREADRQAADTQAKQEADERARLLQEQQAAQQKEEERFRKAAEERKKRDEFFAQKDKERRERLLAQEKKRVAEMQKTGEQRMKEQESLRTLIGPLMEKACDPGASGFEKMAFMAEALAYQRELDRVGPSHGAEPLNLDRINENIKWIVDGAALRIAERDGKLDSLASLSVTQLDKRIKDVEAQVSRAQAGAKDSDIRAQNICRQMDRTWRLMGSSDQFNTAKQAIQNVAGIRKPSQTDHYIAGDAVQKYVAKNLNAAKSAVGMTRMACSLAFLKQTMTEEGFRAYCFGLNSQRRINYTIGEDGLQKYDVNDPRCIVPEEIGTVKEVYHYAHERISKLAIANKMPSMRDFAILTALKNLAAKNTTYKEDLVVEHEALQKEIEAVMRDPRFREGMKRPPEELFEMAWGENLFTMDGYTAPLKDYQIARINQERQREADEQKRLAEEAKKAEEEQNRRKAEEQKRLAEEKAKQEQEEAEKKRQEEERNRQEEERRKFQEENTKLLDCYQKLVPAVESLSSPLRAVLYGLDSEEDAKDITELAASLVALAEFQKTFRAQGGKPADLYVNKAKYKQRVDELKTDPIIQEMGKKFQKGKYLEKKISKLTEHAKTLNLSKEDEATYPTVRLAMDMRAEYAERVEERIHGPKPEPTATIADGYKWSKDIFDKVIEGGQGFNYMDAKVIRSLAIAVAFHEAESKTEQGINAPVDKKAMRKRINQLASDDLMVKISQSISGPNGREAMEKALKGKENREQAFAEFVDGMYKKAQIKNEERNPQPVV